MFIHSLDGVKMERSLTQNINTIKKEFGDSDDVIVKEILSGNKKCAVIYILGLTDTIALSEFIISPLISNSMALKSLDVLKSMVLPFSEISDIDNYQDIYSSIMKGEAILLIDGEQKALSIAVDKVKERAITEPPTSTVLKGPRCGFVENIKTK